jgi:hypothetical protein
MRSEFHSCDTQAAGLAAPLDRFCWRSWDVRTLLPAFWQSEILIVAKDATQSVFYPRGITSRESRKTVGIPMLSVNGNTVHQQLPWLTTLYKGLFRDLVQHGMEGLVSTALEQRYGAILNVQRGTQMRYVCHVDSNPIAGLLYVTDHPKGSGGELVVSNDQSASNVEEVDVDASVIYPVAGHFVAFDARRFAHYVRPLVDPQGERVVVAMNFYTSSCSERDRPTDLDQNDRR